MKKVENNKFLEEALSQIPRILGQLNRNPSSRSYGSFDRAYWHYRTNDISSARYQEAVYTLTLLYFSKFEGNDYYKDDKVLEWIRAALYFTSKIQRPNGSFDEWYVNEGSYVATAFIAAALGQTLMLFRENSFDLKEEVIILRILELAVEFLSQTVEETVLNQVSGAVLAITLVGRLCNREDFTTYSEKLLEDFLGRQNKEGWWSEYGGPDIGYLSLTVSYLEKYANLTGSKKVVEPIRRARFFVEEFINPDHTAGGEYMSRNTEYIIPSVSLPYLGAVKPINLDDRYLCYILYNWIETGLETNPQATVIRDGESYFSESAILRVANSRYFLVANGKKGGSFRLYIGGKTYYDSGLEINGFSTGILDESNYVDFKSGRLESKGSLKKIKEPLLTTSVMIPFKLWQLLFGRIMFLQKTIKDFLRFRMISYAGGSEVSFRRVIEYSTQEVIVTDSIYGRVLEDDIIFGVKASYNAVPSSKYATIPEIFRRRLSPNLEEKTENDVYVIKRTFYFND